MKTGITSFSDPGSITAIYPFVGLELVMVLALVVLWIGWHVLQVRRESEEAEGAIRTYDEIGLDRMMHHGASARIATEEEVRR